MFEYFPDNYVWSMGVMLANEQGGRISEIDDVCRSLRALAATPNAEAQQAWQRQWNALAERVERIAADDESAGRDYSAGDKLHRAALYRFVAERMMSHRDPERLVVYRRMLDDFARACTLRGDAIERVAVPFEGTTLPALFVLAPGPGPKPCMVVFDGFDVMKEFTVWTRLPEQLARRGVSTLIVDHPGVGEALRLQGLTGFHDTERPATASLDYLLASRADVDPARIGLLAPSAGGYYAARALAFEPRFACGVLWTGVWDWGAIVRRRLAGALAHSVSSMAEHAQWVFGVDSMDALGTVLDRMNLGGGIAERIRCPLLITHGASDRQTPVAEARRVYDAVSSTRKTLKIYAPEDGGAEHCQIDNTAIGVDYMADWCAETLGGQLSPNPPDRSS
ncbi:MAG: alpha/beta hydrolase family protein [Rhizobacter sp.]